MISPSVSHDLHRGVSAPIIARLTCSIMSYHHHHHHHHQMRMVNMMNDGGEYDDDTVKSKAGDTVIHLMTQSGSDLS